MLLLLLLLLEEEKEANGGESLPSPVTPPLLLAAVTLSIAASFSSFEAREEAKDLASSSEGSTGGKEGSLGAKAPLPRREAFVAAVVVELEGEGEENAADSIATRHSSARAATAPERAPRHHARRSQPSGGGGRWRSGVSASVRVAGKAALLCSGDDEEKDETGCVRPWASVEDAPIRDS